jgi:Ion channel
MRALLETSMLSKLLIAWGLMAVCVVIHATGVSSAVRWLRYPTTTAPSFWWGTWLFIRLAGWIVLLHLIEITTWALFYVWKAAMADLQSALYFSAVTYTTTGYGDLVLPPEWRLVGAVEALTGILMCGWSTGFFFVVVSRMFQADTKKVDG